MIKRKKNYKNEFESLNFLSETLQILVNRSETLCIQYVVSEFPGNVSAADQIPHKPITRNTRFETRVRVRICANINFVFIDATSD